ncbi:MAG: nucleotidyltransferase domain-containing protein [Oscillospiraceae bacterium]|nr:nucleotidyltransferase domain-containing protein [Oscillospiraceae bacterium]
MAVNQEILNITEAIKQAIPAEIIYLFGSYAYGTPNEDSDYDFFVVIPDGGIKPLDAMQKAHKALIPVNRKTPVDILADYKSRFEGRKHLNSLERKIARDGVVLYERA